MLVTPSGITMDVRDLQPANAYLPMLVTLFGITIDVRDSQSSNAHLPILVTGFSKYMGGISILIGSTKREHFTVYELLSSLREKFKNFNISSKFIYKSHSFLVFYHIFF
jgi:hypothetical protein